MGMPILNCLDLRRVATANTTVFFHSSREEWRTKNSCKGDEEDQKRVRTKVRGISCPVDITISRHVQ